VPEVKICSAYEHTGIAEVGAMIEKQIHYHISNGFFQIKRNEQNIFAFQRLLNEQLRNMLFSKPGLTEKIRQIEQQIASGTISPYSAVKLITA
jgi:LAO/AO transport system kinase